MPMQINEMIDITPDEMVAIGSALSASAAIMWMMKMQWIEKSVPKLVDMLEEEKKARAETRKEAAAWQREFISNTTSDLISGGVEITDAYLERVGVAIAEISRATGKAIGESTNIVDIEGAQPGSGDVITIDPKLLKA